MNFKEELSQLSGRISKLKDQILTEEATKTAFVLPFLQVLGYDVFDPTEVEPEHTCDIGIKKGEKIDYAIKRNNDPILLVECKHWSQDLDFHVNQLFRYYVTSKARFAVLTNGVQYRFFSDVEKSNIMDTAPFLEIDITNINEYQIEQLKKFHKSHFDEQYICETIPSIRYINDTLTNLDVQKIHLENKYAELLHQLEYKQCEFEASLQKINELEEILNTQKETFLQKISNLENALHVQKEASTKVHTTNTLKGKEQGALIDYLNMPVPDDWYEKTLFERRHYYQNERAKWSGTPREFICNAEVAREFYDYERKDVTVPVSRKISDAVRATALFKQDGTKKRFGEYGNALKWIRITPIESTAKKDETREQQDNGDEF